MKLHDVEVNLVPPHESNFKCTIDGHEIRYLRSVQIESSFDGLPIVRIEFIAHVHGHIKGIVKGKAMRFTES